MPPSWFARGGTNCRWSSGPGVKRGGRGRGTHEWWSDSGSLTFTLAIDPQRHGLAVADEPKLALAMAVSIVKALALRFGSAARVARHPLAERP